MDINQCFRNVLADRLGEERFELWVGPHIRFEHVGKTLRAMSCQRFRLDRCRKLLHTELQTLASEMLGQGTTVEYIAATPEAETDSAAIGAERPALDAPRAAAPAADFALKSDSPVVKRGNGPAAAQRVDRPAGGELTARPARRRPFARLDDFVVGESNRMAMQAVELVTGNWGEFTPLVITGPTGSGKTHLLEGIWTRSRAEQPFRRSVYLSSEQFTTYFVEALRGKGLASFRRKYRDVDLLLIDDIQFFTGKRATIVELFYTVDQLAREGRQLVFASDVPPQELVDLGDELINRLLQGLVCRLEPLDIESRRELARRWAAQRELDLDPEVLEVVAAESPGDARRLAGALNMLRVAQRQGGRPLDAAEARRVMGRIFPVQPRAIHLADVERVVCDAFGIEPQQLRSSGRGHALTQPRMLAMWLARKYTRSALSEIGTYFGRRSHSTVVSAQTKVQHWIEQERILINAPNPQSARSLVDQLQQRLSAG